LTCDLAPSILSFDLTDLRDSVKTLSASGARIIHFDVMDGQFVPPITFGDSYVKALRPVVDSLFEAHLMVQTPERQFEAFAAAGCKRIIFHAEATAHAYRLAQSLSAMGVEPGIAINPGTPVQAVEPLLDVVGLVLVMTVNPGWGGQSFLSPTLDKVAHVRRLRPDIDIEVDGGVDPATLPIARAAGANVFVVGSHFARAESLADSVQEMVRLCA
jgi:ribulose-phosphate 3-epimerase